MASLIGQTLQNRYLITAILGKQRGRRTFLATDIKATDTNADAQVVLKLVLFDPDFSWQDLKLFEREAQTLQALSHPAIPQYIDSFEADTAIGNGFVLVQTYIAAKSLQAWVSSGHTFTPLELRAIATGILNILIYLHQQHPPVIHRDIKPSNILFLGHQQDIATSIYLVDFGSVQTAATTGTMTVVGTYGYMPPEQFGGRAQPASDLYSLGTTLIYLATGRHPAELSQYNLQIDDRELTRLEPAFKHWVQQLIKINLAERIPSAEQALQQLHHANRHPSDNAISAIVHTPSKTSLSFRSAHRDFTAFSDPEMLEIQFSPQRLLNNQQFSLPKIKVPLQSNATLYTVGVITLYSVITFLLFSVTLGLRIALITAIISFSLYAAHRAKKRKRKGIKTYQIAHLNIQELTADQLYLTLFIDTYQGKAKEHFEFCSTLPITAITTHQHETAVKFQCLENKEERAVHIKGDRDDIRWFFNALNQWKQLAAKREQTNE